MSDALGSEPSKKLKDWYDDRLVLELAGRFEAHIPSFARSRFVAVARDGLEQLEMMDRVRQIASAMAESFPGPTASDMRGLVACMGPPLPDDGTGMVGTSFGLWPFGEFIGRRGLDDWAASWNAMDELTQRLTSEFAVRPYLAADLPRSLELLEQRLQHPSHHVRRWVSEGTRTRLPWAKAVPSLQGALDTRLHFLDLLKDDPSPYVRRSVANHLQDILKDDQERGLEVLERWACLKLPRLDWVVKHAARGLLKAGHPRVLALFGWDKPVELKSFALSPETLRPGDAATLSVALGNPGRRPLEVRVDYRWDGPTPAGRRFSKVFRWAELTLPGHDTVDLEKKHPFVERSTRKLPPGRYEFTVLVNGQPGPASNVILLS